MTTIQTYLKYAVLAVLLIGVLIGLGVYLINGISDLELRKSTYTRTSFDFHIASPDKAQVQAIEADASVASIFPYYAYAKALSADDVLLLVSDDMADYGASVLCEGTLIEGSFDQSGALLDKTAADALGVGVGDSVTFNLLGQRFTRTVAAIYLPSTLAIMEEGVVLVAADAAIAAVSAPTAYSGAFVVAADRAAAAALLTNYVGEGNVALSREQYVKLHCGNKMPNQTQEEYDAACDEKYAAYRADVLASARKDGGQVVDKEEAYALLHEQILTTEKKHSSLKTLSMVAAFAVFAVVSILFSVTNAANDRILRDDGLSAGKLYLSHAILAAATAALIAIVVGLALLLIAGGTYFAADCAGVVLSLALPTVVGLVPVLLAVFIYVKMLYGSSAAD